MQYGIYATTEKLHIAHARLMGSVSGVFHRSHKAWTN